MTLQARIKKIMQADEDVGKIALAVPVLVCKYRSIHAIHSAVFVRLLWCLRSSLMLLQLKH